MASTQKGTERAKPVVLCAEEFLAPLPKLIETAKAAAKEGKKLTPAAMAEATGTRLHHAWTLMDGDETVLKLTGRKGTDSARRRVARARETLKAKPKSKGAATEQPQATRRTAHDAQIARVQAESDARAARKPRATRSALRRQ